MAVITLPKLLDSNGAEAARLRPLSLSIMEQMVPLSTANMVLMPGDTIPDRSYIELFTANGAAGIFRSRVPKTGYKQTNSYTLEHAICEVGDWLVRAEIEQTQKTLADALDQVFEYYGGTRWQLGTVNATGNVILSTSYGNLLQVMNSLIAQVNGAYVSYDFSTTPWTINVKKVAVSTITAEGRVGRNITGVTIQRDDSNLCTRVWLAGLQNGHMDADTISEYGIVERRLNGDYTASQAATVASAYLARYKQPSYTVTIDGIDFSAITGETLDRVAIGKLYRLAIPEDGVEIVKPIVTISWKDVVNTPTVVTVTLSDPEKTLIDFIRRQEASYESQTVVNDAIEKKIGIFTQQSEKVNSLLGQAGMSLDEDGHIVYDDSDNTLPNRIEQAQTVIRTEVAETTSNIFQSIIGSQSYLYSEIIQTASVVRSEVGNAMSNLWTEIMQTASSIVIRTGDNTKTFGQWTEPTGTAQAPLVDGDLWFKGTGLFTWGDAEDNRWIDATDFDWSETRTTEVYRYNGVTGDWKKVVDEKAILMDTRFDINKEEIRSVAARVDVVDGNIESYRAEFIQRADGIESSVAEQVNGLNSRIEQTATEIKSSVSAANSQIYSEIRQTATNLTSTFENKIDGVRSDISQTANEIMASVSAENSQLYSYIQMTATNISMGVANEVSGLYASISVTAEGIRSDVSAENSQIYSYIQQTATNITMSVNNEISNVRAAISVQADRISLVVQGTGSNAYIKPAGIVAAINNGGSSVIISADHINLDGYVKASDITSDFITAKIANFSSLTSEHGGISVYSVGTTTFTQGDVTCYVPNAISGIRLTQSGDTYTLQRQRFNDSGWVDIGSFSRATTLSGAWSGGTLTVSASPQGNSHTEALEIGNWNWSGTVGTANIYAKNGSGVTHDTGEDATIDLATILTHLGRRELGYMDHGQFESVGNHDWYYRT